MSMEQAVDLKPDINSAPENPVKPAVPTRKGKRYNTFVKNIPYYLMLLPGVVVLIINNYLPMIGVIIPFEDYRYEKSFLYSLFHSQFTGFKNFRFLFNTSNALVATRNTVLYNLLFIALDIIVPVALAIAMSEMWNQTAAKVYQNLMFLPYFISWIVVSYIVYAFFCNKTGFINHNIIKALGMEEIWFYSEPDKWPPILTFFHMWKYTGYNLIVYIASIAGISTEYYEAASLDGASKWQQVKYITLPMLKTPMVILTLIAVGRIFNGDFDLFFNVPRNQGALYSTTDILDTYVYRLLLNLNDVSKSAAAGLYQAVVGCIVVFIANFFVKKVDEDSALF
ncbi:hypothetical protein CCDG5_0291 [[Clostridium] cellulosi]|uniref:ABC transmembrane type-1 domain-containing protein n=1 Tax=[Clostridium] cellulosi TaxID=29343 RepID=A0A078KQP1_9FIRM|nr:hypothetical protein CCDG5_0291 [[Clostridium] cellulosi]